jgi:hypothetical protein
LKILSRERTRFYHAQITEERNSKRQRKLKS